MTTFFVEFGAFAAPLSIQFRRAGVRPSPVKVSRWQAIADIITHQHCTDQISDEIADIRRSNLARRIESHLLTNGVVR